MLNKKLSIALGRLLAKKARLKKQAVVTRKVRPVKNLLRATQPQLPATELAVLHMLIGAFGGTLKAKVKTQDGKLVEKNIDNVLPENIMVKQHGSDEKKKESTELLKSIVKEAKKNKDKELEKAAKKALSTIDEDYLSLEEIKDNLEIYENFVALDESSIYSEEQEKEKKEEVLVYYGPSLEKYIETVYSEINQIVTLNRSTFTIKNDILTADEETKKELEKSMFAIKKQIENKSSKLTLDYNIHSFFLGTLINDDSYATEVLATINSTSLANLDDIEAPNLVTYHGQTREKLMKDGVFYDVKYLKALHTEKFSKLKSFRETQWKSKQLVDSKPHLFTIASSISETAMNDQNQLIKDKDGRRVGVSENVESVTRIREFVGTSNYKSISTKALQYKGRTFPDIIKSFLDQTEAMTEIKKYISKEKPLTPEELQKREVYQKEQEEIRKKQLHQVFAVAVNDKDLNPFEVIKLELSNFKKSKKEEIKDKVRNFKSKDGIEIELTYQQISKITSDIQDEKLVSYVDYVTVPYDSTKLSVSDFEKNEELFKQWCFETKNEFESNDEIRIESAKLETDLKNKYYIQFGLTPPVSSNDIYINLDKAVRTPKVEKYRELYKSKKDTKEILSKKIKNILESYPGTIEDFDEMEQIEIITQYKNIGLNLPFVSLEGKISRLIKVPREAINVDNIEATIHYAREALDHYETELLAIKEDPYISDQQKKLQLEKFKNNPNFISDKEKALYSFYFEPEKYLNKVITALSASNAKEKDVSLFNIYPECSNINSAYLKYLDEINEMIASFKWTPQYKFAALDVTQKNYRDLEKRFAVEPGEISDFTKKLASKWTYIQNEIDKLPVQGQTVLPIFEKKVSQINKLRNQINLIETSNAKKREQGKRQQNEKELEQFKLSLKNLEAEYAVDKKSQQYEPIMDSLFNPKTQTGARSSISLWGETGKSIHSYLITADSTYDFLSTLLNGFMNTLNTIFKRARQLDYHMQTNSEVKNDRLALPEFMKNIVEVKGYKNDELLNKFNNPSVIQEGFSRLTRTVVGADGKRETVSVFKNLPEGETRLNDLVSALKLSMDRRDMSTFSYKAEEILNSKKGGVSFKDQLGLKIPSKEIVSELLSQLVKVKVNGVRLVSDLDVAERVTTYNSTMTFNPYNSDEEGNEVALSIEMGQAAEYEAGGKQRRSERVANFMKVVSILATDSKLTSKLMTLFGTDTIVRTSPKQEVSEIQEETKKLQEREILKENITKALFNLISFRTDTLGSTYQENTQKIIDNEDISLLEKAKIVLKYESNFDGTSDPKQSKEIENALKIALQQAMIEYNEGYSSNFGLDFTLDLKKSSLEEMNAFLLITLALSTDEIDFSPTLSSNDLQDWFLAKVEAKTSSILNEYKKTPDLNILLESEAIKSANERYEPLLKFFIKYLCKNTASVNDLEMQEKIKFKASLEDSAFRAYEYFINIAQKKEILKARATLTKESLELAGLEDAIGLQSYLELEKNIYQRTDTFKTKSVAQVKAQKLVQKDILEDLIAFFTDDFNQLESNLLKNKSFVEKLFKPKEGSIDGIELNIENVSAVVNTIMLKFYVFVVLEATGNPVELFKMNPEWWQLFSLKGTSQNKKLKGLLYTFKTELKSLISRVELAIDEEDLKTDMQSSGSTPKLSLKVLKDNSNLRKQEVINVKNSFGDALAKYLAKNEIEIFDIIENANKGLEEKDKRPNVTFGEVYGVIERDLADGNLARLIESKAKYTDTIEDFKDQEVSYNNQVTQAGKKLIDYASRSNFLNKKVFKEVKAARKLYYKDKSVLEKEIEEVSQIIDEELKQHEIDPNSLYGYYKGIKNTLEVVKSKLSDKMEKSINHLSADYVPSEEEVANDVRMKLLEKNLKKDYNAWHNPEQLANKSDLILLMENTLKQYAFQTFAKYTAAGEYQSFDETNSVFDRVQKELLAEMEDLTNDFDISKKERQIAELAKLRYSDQDKKEILLAKSRVAKLLYSKASQVKRYIKQNGDIVKTNLAKEMKDNSFTQIIYGTFQIDGYSEIVTLLEEKIFKEKNEETKKVYQSILDHLTFKIASIREKTALSKKGYYLADNASNEDVLAEFKNGVLVVIGELNTLIDNELKEVNIGLKEEADKIIDAKAAVDGEGNPINLGKIKESAVAKLKNLKNSVNEKELTALQEILKRGVNTLYLVAEELLSEIDNIKDGIQKAIVNPFLTELKESNFNALTTKV